VKPLAVAFDVNETLISLEPMATRMEEVGLPGILVKAWFPRTLLYGLGLSVAGDYVSFPAAAAESLRAVSGYTLSEEAVAHVMAGFAGLPAHPDVEPAMKTLAAGGVRMICLTNGNAEVTQAFLDRCGLAGYIEQVVATSEVNAWKPPAKVYHHGASRLGLPPEQVALVAVHAWDCHAAKRAGLMAGWAARAEGGYGEIFSPADVMGADLLEVAEGLLNLT
jgi:2-haloacid dehalogenase